MSSNGIEQQSQQQSQQQQQLPLDFKPRAAYSHETKPRDSVVFGTGSNAGAEQPSTLRKPFIKTGDNVDALEGRPIFNLIRAKTLMGHPILIGEDSRGMWAFRGLAMMGMFQLILSTTVGPYMLFFSSAPGAQTMSLTLKIGMLSVLAFTSISVLGLSGFTMRRMIKRLTLLNPLAPISEHCYEIEVPSYWFGQRSNILTIPRKNVRKIVALPGKSDRSWSVWFQVGLPSTHKKSVYILQTRTRGEAEAIRDVVFGQSLDDSFQTDTATATTPTADAAPQ